MSEFTIRSESVDVEQIMKQIRQRILEKRGADYTEDQIRELATVRLEKFLDPNNLRSDLLEQFRKSRPATVTEPPAIDAAVYVGADGFRDAPRRAALPAQAVQPAAEAAVQPEHAAPGAAHAGAVQRRPPQARGAPQDRVRSLARGVELALLRGPAQPGARDDAHGHRGAEPAHEDTNRCRAALISASAASARSKASCSTGPRRCAAPNAGTRRIGAGAAGAGRIGRRLRARGSAAEARATAADGSGGDAGADAAAGIRVPAVPQVRRVHRVRRVRRVRGRRTPRPMKPAKTAPTTVMSSRTATR